MGHEGRYHRTIIFQKAIGRNKESPIIRYQMDIKGCLMPRWYRGYPPTYHLALRNYIEKHERTNEGGEKVHD